MKFLSIDDIKNASNIILITERITEKELKINKFPKGNTIILFLKNAKQLKNYKKKKRKKNKKVYLEYL